VALEWEREAESAENDFAQPAREIDVPYGMQISEDGWHLVESAAEMRVLMSAVNMIVDDQPMSRVADELNRQGYRKRSGDKWTAAARD
jgi:hypothetical protein